MIAGPLLITPHVPSVVTVLPRHRRSQSQGLRAREDSAACLPVAPS